jgi:predicted acylesterase/phospholipase RssA
LKRALVLSAGGMFGAYQAGVWEVLHRSFKPDLIVGASVGSLNGYLIACGSAPDDLIRRWQSLGDVNQVRWRMARLASGLLDPGPLEMLIQEICQTAPECEYALVATETRTCRPRLFAWPDITWKHIAASCGVPVFLPTHQINGVYYSDGGLVDPLPLWAALELGATEVVTVDVMNRRPLPVRAAIGVLQAWAGYKRPQPERVQVLEINPSRPLGSVRDSIYWSRANTDRWIELGRQDAQSVLTVARTA